MLLCKNKYSVNSVRILELWRGLTTTSIGRALGCCNSHGCCLSLTYIGINSVGTSRTFFCENVKLQRILS